MRKLIALLLIMFAINANSQVVKQGIFGKEQTDLSECATRDIAITAFVRTLPGHINVVYPYTDSMMCITIREFEVYKQTIDCLLQQVAKLEHEMSIQASFNVQPSLYHYKDTISWVNNPKPLNH